MFNYNKQVTCQDQNKHNLEKYFHPKVPAYSYSMEAAKDYVEQCIEKIKCQLWWRQGVRMHINQCIDAQFFMQPYFAWFIEPKVKHFLQIG